MVKRIKRVQLDCFLVGTYILNIISSVIPKENIGLYRDDGLATICQPAPVVEHIQKKLRKEFNQLGLNITVQAHITTTDFLDITFDLAKKEYQPYTKPGNSHLYVHTESNHPPTITKRIPKSIEARLSNISSNEAIFNKAKPAYEKALRTAGHRTTLNYQPKNPTTQNAATPKTNRQRNITWYNPPYSAHVKSNIGRKFLALIEQHFPPNHELQQICNKCCNAECSYRMFQASRDFCCTCTSPSNRPTDPSNIVGKMFFRSSRESPVILPRGRCCAHFRFSFA